MQRPAVGPIITTTLYFPGSGGIFEAAKETIHLAQTTPGDKQLWYSLAFSAAAALAGGRTIAIATAIAGGSLFATFRTHREQIRRAYESGASVTTGAVLMEGGGLLFQNSVMVFAGLCGGPASLFVSSRVASRLALSPLTGKLTSWITTQTPLVGTAASHAAQTVTRIVVSGLGIEAFALTTHTVSCLGQRFLLGQEEAFNDFFGQAHHLALFMVTQKMVGLTGLGRSIASRSIFQNSPRADFSHALQIKTNTAGRFYAWSAETIAASSIMQLFSQDDFWSDEALNSYFTRVGNETWEFGKLHLGGKILPHHLPGLKTRMESMQFEEQQALQTFDEQMVEARFLSQGWPDAGLLSQAKQFYEQFQSIWPSPNRQENAPSIPEFSKRFDALDGWKRFQKELGLVTTNTLTGVLWFGTDVVPHYSEFVEALRSKPRLAKIGMRGMFDELPGWRATGLNILKTLNRSLEVEAEPQFGSNQLPTLYNRTTLLLYSERHVREQLKSNEAVAESAEAFMKMRLDGSLNQLLYTSLSFSPLKYWGSASYAEWFVNPEIGKASRSLQQALLDYLVREEATLEIEKLYLSEIEQLEMVRRQWGEAGPEAQGIESFQRDLTYDHPLSTHEVSRVLLRFLAGDNKGLVDDIAKSHQKRKLGELIGLHIQQKLNANPHRIPVRVAQADGVDQVQPPPSPDRLLYDVLITTGFAAHSIDSLSGRIITKERWGPLERHFADTLFAQIDFLTRRLNILRQTALKEGSLDQWQARFKATVDRTTFINEVYPSIERMVEFCQQRETELKGRDNLYDRMRIRRISDRLNQLRRIAREFIGFAPTWN
ncbi:MAG: hypothetical protein HYT77_05585 [Deltaproteobacteria bacterium]|nr:hypothetical protein [Deltaproteobacteria bacterium]